MEHCSGAFLSSFFSFSLTSLFKEKHEAFCSARQLCVNRTIHANWGLYRNIIWQKRHTRCILPPHSFFTSVRHPYRKKISWFFGHTKLKVLMWLYTNKVHYFLLMNLFTYFFGSLSMSFLKHLITTTATHKPEHDNLFSFTSSLFLANF